MLRSRRWHIALWLLVIATMLLPRAVTGGPRRGGRRHRDAVAPSRPMCWVNAPAGADADLPGSSQECSDPEEEDEEQRIASPGLPLLIPDAMALSPPSAERSPLAARLLPHPRLRC